ncbi:MAG: UDP-N-acetylglucosamine 2-epimerase (non-hydrolyzing) [Candidatus Paceibacterota bacterium]|jgi:UDP-N-acetylglucosamine 2-epimerase (non-hydrolysing)
MSLKIAIILGTRPEIIKMSPVIKACQQKSLDFFVIHTGQHYDHELDGQIFEDLDLPKPRFNLQTGGQPYHLQISQMVRGITEILQQEKTTVVIVQGDTSSVLTGALAASKLVGIKVVHHEAGLRSHDLTMLEEINRIIVDSISDLLFTPTQNSSDILIKEGKKTEDIYLVGNTIVDAVQQNITKANSRVSELEKLGISAKNYILASAHRAENVGVRERLEGILEGLSLTGRELGLPVIFSLHPRTKAKIEEFKIKVPTNIKFINPVGFLDLLLLESNAALVMTDSGGLQEEALILRVPCVTLRDNTERPETVESGANMLCGTEPKNILAGAKEMFKKDLKSLKLDDILGDGQSGLKIIETIENLYGGQ